MATLFLSLVGFQKSAFAQPDGKALFKANCASCHHPVNAMVGPALKGAKQRWSDAGVAEEIYNWVKDPAATAKAVPYAKDLKAKYDAKGTPIMSAQMLNKEEVDAVLAYADNFTEEGPKAGAATAHDKAYFDQKFEEEGSSWTMWLIVLGVIFTAIALGMGGVRKQLTRAQLQHLNKPVDERSTYSKEARSWMWANKKLVSVIGIFLTFMLLSAGWYGLKDIGVYEGYRPTQPIWFSHEVHAGINKINCQYCHSTVEKSRTASLPTPMVCMNCHKNIKEGTITGKEEIAKIYKAVGFDPENNVYIENAKTEPIKWVKVHALPDHAYFNHSQHVVAGKLDCSQCHGKMEEMDVARIQPHTYLNTMQANVDANIKFGDRPTLTMGWCIDCHAQAKVQMDKNGYYDEMKKRLMLDKKLYQKHLDDENITVKDMGGWECSKCHY
ncbi:MAG TPA: c-type cytochrome [Flavobacteriales bacterium]|nr:c-type cytochrome [Flavobacteriales bacterium]